MNIPSQLLPWLHLQGSLTNKLEQLASQPLQVELIHEGYNQLKLAHTFKLALTKPQMAWHRETMLFGDDDKPWVYANSYFPTSSLVGSNKRLKHMGNKPLGYALFTRNKPIERHFISQTQIEDQLCFTRNNFYLLNNKPLLITETFLPIFLEKIKKQTL